MNLLLTALYNIKERYDNSIDYMLKSREKFDTNILDNRLIILCDDVSISTEKEQFIVSNYTNLIIKKEPLVETRYNFGVNRLFNFLHFLKNNDEYDKVLLTDVDIIIQCDPFNLNDDLTDNYIIGRELYNRIFDFGCANNKLFKYVFEMLNEIDIFKKMMIKNRSEVYCFGCIYSKRENLILLIEKILNIVNIMTINNSNLFEIVDQSILNYLIYTNVINNVKKYNSIFDEPIVHFAGRGIENEIIRNKKFVSVNNHVMVKKNNIDNFNVLHHCPFSKIIVPEFVKKNL